MIQMYTNSMMINNFMQNYGVLREKMMKLQNQLASGKYFEFPSDDTHRMSKSMELKQDQSESMQYQNNISEARSWLDVTYAALSSVTQFLQRSKELTVTGLDGTKTQTELNAIAEEVEEILESMVQIGNTNHRGSYIFAGHNTQEVPFTYTEDANGRITDVNYDGDSGLRKVGIGKGLELEVNSLGGGGDGMSHKGVFVDNIAQVNIFDTLINLRDDLLSGNVGSITNTRFQELNEALDNIIFNTTQIGAKINRLDVMNAKYDEQLRDLYNLIDENENIDYAKYFTEFQKLQTVYQATMGTGTRIIQASILNYMS